MDQGQIVHALDLCGIAVFAVSGSLAAGRKRMDIFGVVVLGLVTALGGGTLRDTLLDTGPVFWVTDPSYLLIGVVASVLTFVVVRRLSVPWRSLLLSDALGLAVVTVLGTAKALDATDSGSVAVVMGIMTGVVGGMIRDILSAEVPLILRKEVYATACLCGSLIYVAMSRLALPGTACLIVPVLTTLSIRLAAIHWGLSLPRFVSKDDIGTIEPENKEP
jgi:uncharacterized membrane protein YeiH